MSKAVSPFQQASATVPATAYMVLFCFDTPLRHARCWPLHDVRSIGSEFGAFGEPRVDLWNAELTGNNYMAGLVDSGKAAVTRLQPLDLSLSDLHFRERAPAKADAPIIAYAATA